MSYIEEKKIKEALVKGTDTSTELKDMVWKNIDNQLNSNITRRKRKKTSRINFSNYLKYGSIAAAIAVVVFFNTDYGIAAANKIREIFAPNKVITEEIEGMKEENNASLKESSMNYIIYIDDERYSMENIDGVDRIVPKAKAENLPSIYMEIKQVKDKSKETLSQEIEKELKSKYNTVNNIDSVTTPINSLLIQGISGTKWNDVIEKYYLVDNTKGGTFVIKQHFFVEAEEGHGARFANMLKEFKIVEAQ